MKTVKNIVCFLGLILIAVGYDHLSKKSNSDAYSLINDEDLHTLTLALDAYESLPKVAYASQDSLPGKLSLIIEEDKSTAYFVFRGTDLVNQSEVSINLVLVYSFLMFSWTFLFMYLATKKNLYGSLGLLTLAALLIHAFVFYNKFEPSKYQGNSRSLVQSLEQNLKNDGHKDLENYLLLKKIKFLTFTGHSKGGAEATIAFLDFDVFCKQNSMTCKLRTIGSAPTMPTYIDDSRAINIVFELDTVKLLNPLKYYGTLIEINRNIAGVFFLIILLPMFACGFLCWLLKEKLTQNRLLIVILLFFFLYAVFLFAFNHREKYYRQFIYERPETSTT